MFAFIRLFRLPNLALVYLTQYLPYWYALRPAILKAGGIPVLTQRTFDMMAAATVLTTLGGYVLNDYFDREMDAINKPKRLVWGKWLPAWVALALYALIVGVVHYLAFQLDAELRPRTRWPLWVYPGVSFLLFLYAWQMKCSAVMGNLLVSFLCAVVPIVVIFPEERPLWLTSFVDPDAIHQATALVWLYGIFAFVTNLLREQVKDLEDFPGDSACGCTTLAVTKGPRFAKKPAGFTGITASILVCFLLYFWYETQAPQWQIIAGVIFLLIPAIFTTVAIYRAKGVSDYSRASLYIKIIMFFGLFLMLRSWPEKIF